jgi:hypothetical protein
MRFLKKYAEKNLLLKDDSEKFLIHWKFGTDFTIINHRIQK